MIRTVVLSFVSAFLCTSITIFGLHISSAQVMQSTNYQIQSDSLNIGGIDNSTSTNYALRSTIGENASGDSDSSSYSIGAGYRQMQAVYISLSGVSNISMTPSIPGVSGGTANGSTTLTVITDSPSGYTLTIESENDPAMNKGANSIADYNPGSSPSFSFSVNDGEAYLAYSPEGEDITSRYQDNGGDCNDGGSLDTVDSCWDGLTTGGQTISSATNPNHPNGATTTIKFKVGVGSGVNLDPGSYVATTTVTALPL